MTARRGLHSSSTRAKAWALIGSLKWEPNRSQRRPASSFQPAESAMESVAYALTSVPRVRGSDVTSSGVGGSKYGSGANSGVGGMVSMPLT